MKKICIFALVVVMGLALIWWHGCKRARNEKQNPTSNSSSESFASIDRTNVESQKKIILPQPPSGKRTVDTITVEEYVKRSMEDLQYDWKQPINLYGRVVDETNNPVVNANAHFQWTDLSPTGTSQADVKSDENGFFSFTNRRGKRLSVEVYQSGYYETSTSRCSFEYANPADGLFHADPNNPVIFHLRKRGVGVELVTSVQGTGINSDLHLALPANGSPVFIDLFNRQIGDSGQLKTEAWKEPKNFKTGQNNWGIRLTVPNGGLIEENDEFPFEAPDSDYQSVMEWYFKDGDSDWKGVLKKSFYIKFGNPPRYGILSIKTTAFAPGAYLKYIFNPTGSQYLEPK